MGVMGSRLWTMKISTWSVPIRFRLLSMAEKQVLGGIADKLAWVEKSRARPSDYVGNHQSVGIVGPQGMIADERFKFGVFSANA